MYLRRLESPIYWKKNDYIDYFGQKNQTGDGQFQLNHPNGVCFSNDGKYFVILDSFNGRIKLYKNMVLHKIFGQQYLQHPIKVVMSKDNRIFVSDNFHGDIFIYNINGELNWIISESFPNIHGISINSYDNTLAVVDQEYKSIFLIYLNEEYRYDEIILDDVADSITEVIKDCAFTNDDKHLVVTEFNLNGIILIDLFGNMIMSFGFNYLNNDLFNPTAIYVDINNNYIVQDRFKIQLYDMEGNSIRTIKNINRGCDMNNFGGIHMCPITFKLAVSEEETNFVYVL